MLAREGYSLKLLNSKDYPNNMASAPQRTMATNGDPSQVQSSYVSKNHRVKTLIMLRVWTQARRVRRSAETLNGGWLRTAQHVDRKGPRAEMLGQSEHLSAGGTQSISPSCHNGNACWPSNRWLECERQPPTMAFPYRNPWDPAWRLRPNVHQYRKAASRRDQE
jgi:hypothetical protein